MASNFNNANGKGNVRQHRGGNTGFRGGSEPQTEPGRQYKAGKRIERAFAAEDTSEKLEVDSLIASHRPPGGYRAGGFAARIASQSKNDREIG